MKNKITKYFAAVVALTMVVTSCTKDLDREPYYGLNAANVYETPANYYKVLAKCYAGFALTGNQGPAGSPDITGFDEGSSGFLRTMWNLQELTTDEAVCGWNDPGVPDLHNMSWSSENVWTKFMYYRMYYEIPLCNEFIRESSDSKLETKSFSAEEKKNIRLYREEARFLRALAYYYALDLFGNVPFVTEDDLTGATLPKRITRADLFNYVEKELLAIEATLSEPRTIAYGRADKSAARSLLARLYLNAEVYTGTKKYTETVNYCNKVINSGYQLDSVYRHLFQVENDKSPEMIFPIVFDGRYTQTYGGTTYLTHAAVGGLMNKKKFGINGGWAGLRTTSAFVNQFADTIDGRYLFFKDGQSLEINAIGTFTDGYAIAKWRNVTYDKDSTSGSDGTGNFVDIDWPMFRLADIYLMYAEATLRGGAGNAATALGYVNALRERAYGNSNNNLSNIDLNIILNERAKEMHWEGTRRSDLIRYGLFTTSTYLWPWKGGVKDGIAVGDFRNLFPIPASDLSANSNLIQNPGY